MYLRVLKVVPCKGSIKQIIFQLLGGIRAGLGYTGSGDIDDLHKKANFVQVTASGVKESMFMMCKLSKKLQTIRSSNGKTPYIDSRLWLPIDTINRQKNREQGVFSRVISCTY